MPVEIALPILNPRYTTREAVNNATINVKRMLIRWVTRQLWTRTCAAQRRCGEWHGTALDESVAESPEAYFNCSATLSMPA
jgi:hypothetical protein